MSTAPKKTTTKKAAKRKLLEWGEDGLIKGVDYKFDNEGFIDWRAMVSPDMVYPNREWFLKNDQPVPDSVEGLKDDQLLIKLGGLKKLLRLRGFSNVRPMAKHIREGYVQASVSITFAPNYETNGQPASYTEVANASEENTDGFGEKFLETFAANRAFARCIRNFLNINIVSAEEMDKSGRKKQVQASSGSSNAGFSPQDSLQRKAEEKGLRDWSSFVNHLRNLYSKNKDDFPIKPENIANWKKFKDISATDARKLIGFI